MIDLVLKPELLIYLYMASCVSVLIFNIAYIFVDKYGQNHQSKKRYARIDNIQDQLNNIGNGETISTSHVNELIRNLRDIKKLKTFENSLDELKKETENQIFDSYLKQIRIVFIRLIQTYEKRDVIEKAYFAYLIEKLKIDRGQDTFDPLMEFLVQLTINKDVFVRENALRALFSIGNKEAVLSSWEKMETNLIRHNVKLLADGLLRYSGDKEALINLLYNRCESFDVHLVLPILQFIRFYSGHYQEEFKQLLQRESTHMELRLEAIRYFRKYPYEPVREDIQKFVRYQEYIDWEYAAVAAQSLSSYPGKDTVNCLKSGLKATNWYVRLNCAEALIVGMKISQLELFDIYNGPDRYAREILQYVTDKIDINRYEMELTKDHV